MQNVGTHNVLTYGGNFRQNLFDLTIAPAADNRTEGGAYVQDEIFLGKYVRWIVGARVDKFENIDDPQFSPRTSLMLKPSAQQTVRLSYNRAFRAPSVINNYLDTVDPQPAAARHRSARRWPAACSTSRSWRRGNKVEIPNVPSEDLTEQSITAYEVGYTGIIRQRATVTAAWFQNDTKNDVFFTQVALVPRDQPAAGLAAAARSCSSCSTARRTRRPAAPARSAPASACPRRYSYRNFGKVRQRGVEFGVDGAFSKELSAFANYSYQPNAARRSTSRSRRSTCRRRTGSTSASTTAASRFLGNLAVSYQDEAYWQDVLDARYAGTTDAFTQVNAARPA